MTKRAVTAIAAVMAATVPMIGPAMAQHAPKPLFTANEPVKIAISAPIRSLPGATAPLAGTLTVAGSADALPITLTTRGITRRKREICSFPPIRVDFSAPPPATSPFAGQHSLKLVTHCQPDKEYEQRLLVEYATHRMYQVLTPISYRVRLADIDYQNERGKPQVHRYGFFIEDIGDVAKRNGLRHFKTTARVNPDRLSRPDAARFALFEDMISNLDWSMVAGPPGATCCHNAKLLVAKDGAGPLVPIPYDYDESGLVDAPYAAPPAGIPVTDVRTRRYRGYCRTAPEARAAAADFLAKRGDLVGTFDQVPDLQSGMKRKAASYLRVFFDQLGDQAALTKLLSTCIAP